MKVALAARGVSWMVVAALGFTCVPVTVRYLVERLPVVEIILLRNLVALLPALPMLLRSGPRAFRTSQLSGHAIRALLIYGALLSYFWGITVVPLADATAIQFLIPIFAALGGVLLLREEVTPARVLAAGAGLAGALLVIQPGVHLVGLHTLAIVVSAVFYAGSWLMVKRLSRRDSPSVIVVYLNLLSLPLSLLPALSQWTPLVTADLLPLLILGLGGWIAHYAQARAFGYGDVSALAPLDFLRLPLIALAAYLVFDQVPRGTVWLGGAVIIVAATYLARVENRKAIVSGG